jgi:phosphoribosylformylglycinamidine synthase
VHGIDKSTVPHFDLQKEFDLQTALKGLISSDAVRSLHDISEGGLFTCLMESSMPNNLGFVINTDSSFRKDAYLFGEAQSRVVASVSADKVAEFENQLAAQNVLFSKLGKVSNGDLAIDGQDFGSLADWTEMYNTTIENKLEN